MFVETVDFCNSFRLMLQKKISTHENILLVISFFIHCGLVCFHFIIENVKIRFTKWQTSSFDNVIYFDNNIKL